MQAIPYAGLVLLSAVLLMPGVVPHGPACGDVTGAASVTERQLFIHFSAVAFGLVAALLLLSAWRQARNAESGDRGCRRS